MDQSQKKFELDIKKQEELEKQKQNREIIPFRKLFRFATPRDWVFMILGSACAIVNGLSMSAFSILFGGMTDAYNTAKSKSDTFNETKKLSLQLFLVGVGSCILSFLQFLFWMTAGDYQGIEYRKKYFSALLLKHIGWHDKVNPNELSSKVANECQRVQNAIGEKVSTFLMTFAMFFGGIIVGFIKGWHLALIIFAFVPLMALTAYLLTYMTQTVAEKQNSGYQEASGFAEQAFAQIRSVKSLCSEDFELGLYEKGIIYAKKIAQKYGLLLGFAVGLTYCVMDSNFGLGLFFGGIFIDKEVINPISDKIYSLGDILAVYFSIVFAAFSIGQASPCFKSFAQGQQAAYEIFKVLDEQPEIIVDDPTKLKPETLNGNIEFKNVNFSYPTKKETPILKNVSVIFEKNKKTALVGESGCGKSTIMQMIERFYDADNGEVLINETPIKDYNVKRLRQLIGYVGQEPVLFSASIRENLLFGKDDATEEQMVNALKQANAWEFVSCLKEGLDFQVGINATRLSGGQKQRIAIARALLKNPQILLLDEATSALDRKSEKLIQETLDQISKEKTTIIIAHKLQTIQNSDKILLVSEGQIAESGTHEELMILQQKYYALIKLQLFDNSNNSSNLGSPINNNEVQEPFKFDEIKEKNISKGSSDENSDIKIKKGEYVKIQINDTGALSPNLNTQQGFIEEDKGQDIEKNKQKQLEELEKIKIEKKQKSKENWGNFMRLFKYNKGSYGAFSIGIICALLNGVIFPAMSIPIVKFMVVLSIPDKINKKQFTARDFNHNFMMDVTQWMLIIVGLAIFHCLMITAEQFIFQLLSQNLTRIIRKQCFQKIITMPVPFFDNPDNNPGILSSKLSVAATKINGLTTSSFETILTVIGALSSGIIISFIYSWRISLLSLGFLPLMVISSMIQMQFMEGFASKSQKDFDASTGIIQESLCNIRTVASFSNEDKLLHLFDNTLAAPKKTVLAKAISAGFAFACSQLIQFSMFACIFFVGGVLQKKNYLNMEKLYVSIFSIMNAGFAAGQGMQYMPDAGSALSAAKEIFTLLDSKDEKMEISSNQNVINKDALNVIKKIEFNNVKFQYPTRNEPVFQNLSLTVEEGQSVAFVGPSGCGKSTLFSLLLRFYDIQGGEVKINGIDIKNYNHQDLRQIFGVVQQEPVLFNGTVKYNIIYNTPNVNEEQMKLAAANANALTFIEKNQFDCEGKENEDNGNGFDRKVGPKGSQISGGQKQRIAIARAIIKNPKILLLDEATSALDSESESLVQQSLQKLMKEKTSITIAHRLSTIKNCDKIYMFTDGVIVESGTFDQLIEAKGHFYNFAQGFN